MDLLSVCPLHPKSGTHWVPRDAGGREGVRGGEITSSPSRLTGGHSGKGSMVLDWGIPIYLQFSSPLLCVGRAGGFKVREEGDLLTSCETAGLLSRGGPSSP